LEKPDLYPHKNAGSRSALKSTNSGALEAPNGARDTLDSHNEGMEAQMHPWRICGPVIAESQHSEEGQDPDLDPHFRRLRIRIKVTRIRNPGCSNALLVH
jgi:hypothetical protein